MSNILETLSEFDRRGDKIATLIYGIGASNYYIYNVIPDSVLSYLTAQKTLFHDDCHVVTAAITYRREEAIAQVRAWYEADQLMCQFYMIINSMLGSMLGHYETYNLLETDGSLNIDVVDTLFHSFFTQKKYIHNWAEYGF